MNRPAELDRDAGHALAVVEALVRPDVAARPRMLAVLDGVLTGRVVVDDPTAPSWAVIVETADGTVWAGGDVTRERLGDALRGLETRSGDLIFGFAGPDDLLRDLVPTEPYWRGEAIDFTDREPPPDEPALADEALPDTARLVEIDARRLRATAWAGDTLHAFGSEAAWERLGVGFGVVVDGRLVAEATAGPRARGMLEMGVATREEHRGRGFGTLVSRCVARTCEARGDRVWWNANAGNLPSLAIARKLGFRTERRYDLVACRAPLGGAAGAPCVSPST